MKSLSTIFVVLCLGQAIAEDWRMGGRTQDRNPVSPEKNPPIDWQFPDRNIPGKNIRWSARVGSRAIGGPVVANGLVWSGDTFTA